MSNRQERIDCKARKRRNKLLSTSFEVPGAKVAVKSSDYDRMFSMTVTCLSDGRRNAINMRCGRKWRRMEEVVADMLSELTHWVQNT